MSDPQPKPEPCLTLRFFTDGTVETIPGPARFPIDPDDVKRVSGAVLLILWQIGQMGYERMLAIQNVRNSMDEHLRQMPTQGDPI